MWLLGRLGNQTLPFHTGRHRLAIVFVALVIKVKYQPFSAATALAGLKGLGHQVVKLLTFQLPLAWIALSVPPSVIAAT